MVIEIVPDGVVVTNGLCNFVFISFSSTAESGPNELQIVKKIPERFNKNVQVPGEKFVEKRFKCTFEGCFRYVINSGT